MMADGWLEQMRRAARRGVLGALVCVCAQPVAAFELRVRGSAELLVDARAAGTALQLFGTLRDENKDALPQRDVKLVVRAALSGRVVHEATLRSDMSGKLHAQIELEEGDYEVELKIASDEHFDGASARALVHLEEAPRKVELQAPAVVFGPAGEASARVRASAGGVGVRGRVRALLGGQALEPVELDAFGRGQLKLAPGLAQSGRYELEARLEGDRTASAATTLRYVAAPDFELVLEQGYQGLEYGLIARATLEDAYGPLAGLRASVTFMRADAPDAPPIRSEARTDEQGRLRVFVPAREVGQGALIATAKVRADAGAVAVLTSQPAGVDRRGSQRWLHVFGVLAIVFGLGALRVRLASLDLAGWWAARRAKPAAAQPVNLSIEEALVAEAADARALELVVAPAHDQLGGLVWDVWRARPVAGAALALVDPVTQAPLVTWSADERGRFVSPPLPAGDHQLVVTARGFARGVMSVRLPHTGSLSAIKLQLVAMPLKLRRTYQAWSAQRSGEEVWGKRTPREIAAMLRGVAEEAGVEHKALERLLDSMTLGDGLGDAIRDGVSDPVVAVTRLVEEGYFGEREDADEALWGMMVALIKRLDESAPERGPLEDTR
jgi:hypothetical protein